MRDGQQAMVIPLDKEIVTAEGFDFIKQVKIENALKLRIEGSPQQAEPAPDALPFYVRLLLFL